VFKLFSRFLKPFIGLVVGACVFTLLQVVGELQLPNIMARIVDTGIYNKDMGYVLVRGAEMLAWAVGAVVCVVIAALCASRAAMGFGRNIRAAIFSQAQTYSLAEFGKFGASTLITRNTNDVQQIERFLQMLITMAVMAPVMFIGAAVMAFMTNTQMALIILIAIPIILLIVAVFLKIGMPILRSLQSRIDAVNRVMREELQGVRAIRAYNKEGFERKRFGTVNRNLANNYIQVGRLMGAIMPLLMFVVNITIVALYYFGAVQIDSGTLTAGEIMALVQYVTLILMSLMMLSMIFALLPRTLAASERINEVLSTTSSIKDASKQDASKAACARPAASACAAKTSIHADQAETHTTQTTTHTAQANAHATQTTTHAAQANQASAVLEMKDVSFHYPESKKDALQHLSFSLNPGTTTALIGPTGSGKTSLINLIMRMYDASEGAIYFEGVPLKEIPLDVLRSRISYTPQKSFLFTGTVASNLRFANPEATDEQLWQVLSVAQATEFISAQEKGLNTEIAQGGENLSGGQRQRVAIARGLLRPAQLYIFDDSFSALDFKTDALVRKGIEEYLNGQSVLMVTQRVSVALSVDQVIMLNETGGIEACGTHEELFETCLAYKELALSQLSEEELRPQTTETHLQTTEAHLQTTELAEGSEAAALAESAEAAKTSKATENQATPSPTTSAKGGE
jgi:ATP-binding cassette subfamily B protein